MKTFAFVDPHSGHPTVDEVRLSHQLTPNIHACYLQHVCNLSTRFTSTVGWKSVPMMPIAHSSAPSSVSASQCASLFALLYACSV